MASPEQRQQALERAEVFLPDFPRRARLTHAQWAGLSDEQRLEARSAELIAIKRATTTKALVDLITEIGGAKQESAVPLLAKLWSDCALVPVRIAAGHALRAIGSRDARAALVSLIEDPEHLSVVLAVQAVFDADPGTAFDRFAAFFDPSASGRPGGRVIPEAVIRTFGPQWSPRNGKPGWAMAEPRWFEWDERWMDLCVRLRRDEHLGYAARAVLRVVDSGRVGAKLAQARSTEEPRIVQRQSAAAGDLLARYRRGEHAAVWAALRRHEAIDADCRAEAMAVAAETMTRVARCVDRLTKRLASRGWLALTGQLRWLPNAGDSKIMHDIEQITGASLPPSLRAFWSTVGGVDFVWNYETAEPAPDFGLGLALAEMDPLHVAPPAQTTYLLELWQERWSDVYPELNDPRNLDLAPDYLHKANISGGEPYGIELPYLGADPVFMNEAHRLPLVDYLRLAFRWGGFPGLERHANSPAVRAFVTDMVKDLEPF